MKKILVFLILAFSLTLTVKADDNYTAQYNNVGADRLSDSLDGQTLDFFEQSGIDAENPDWVNRLTAKNVLSYIYQIVSEGIKKPLKTGVLIAAVIFLSACFTAFGTSKGYETAIYVTALCIAALIAANLWQSVTAAVNTVKSCSTFMLSFVPVFASILALSGKAVTASATSALLLAAGEGVSFVSSFTILPLMSGYLSLSIASGVSPLLNNSGIAEGIKKLSIWLLSLLGTLFIGILSIQTAVNSAADSVALRTARFIVGTSVPVAGGVLSEAVATISASMELLRSSVGIYAVVAIAVMLLPIVVEVVLWRCVFGINIALTELFSQTKIAGILRAVDSTLSVLLGIILLIGGVFIISLSVIVTAGR